MSDVTRQPGGSPAERDTQTPDARGETALGTGPASGARAGHGVGPAGGIDPAPGARADQERSPVPRPAEGRASPASVPPRA
ncbi:hypothetical protein ABZ841_23955, partial [Streptomyces flaveolus]